MASPTSEGPYRQHFDELVNALKSLKIFPQVIKQCTSFLKQMYLRKDKPSELFWIDKLCGVYKDNCKHYATFIKRVVADQFFAKSLQVDDVERADLIIEFKANINAANESLDNFLGETGRKKLLDKVDGELSKLEEDQQKDNKSEGNAMEDEVFGPVGMVFAKVVGHLWDMVYTHAAMAIMSDYDEDALKEAVQNIQGGVPKMKESLDMNRKALNGIGYVLDVFSDMLERREDDLARQEMRSLFDLQNNIIDACDHITELLEALNDE